MQPLYLAQSVSQLQDRSTKSLQCRAPSAASEAQWWPREVIEARGFSLQEPVVNVNRIGFPRGKPAGGNIFRHIACVHVVLSQICK